MRLTTAATIFAALLLLGGCRPGGHTHAEGLTPCRLPGIEREVLCGSVSMPENPDAPSGRVIDIHYVVVPAIARTAQSDPVFVLAGGPGQAARRVIGLTMPIFAELNARRDVVFVDQRGTGRSNTLDCPESDASLAATLDPSRLLESLRECLHGLASDTRQYATWIAVRDLDAVRRQLGAPRINLWGASYGTRVALEYLRQFPQQVRTVVLDGVAPPDMILPAAFSIDADAALAALVAVCKAEARCSARFPDFEARIDSLAARAATGFDVTIVHPLTGQPQTLHVDRRLLASLLRVPLYVPSLAAVLPQALATAATGDYGALVSLAAAVSGRSQENLALGMHFAVICAEDMPSLTDEVRRTLEPTRFGPVFADLYADACASLLTRPVPAEFRQVPRSEVPVLVLSGGLDPATPPRHGDSVVTRLGNARHIVAPYLGHGISGQACGPRLITQFIRAEDFRQLDASCLEKLPAAAFFEPIEPTGPALQAPR